MNDKDPFVAEFERRTGLNYDKYLEDKKSFGYPESDRHSERLLTSVEDLLKEKHGRHPEMGS